MCVFQSIPEKLRLFEYVGISFVNARNLSGHSINRNRIIWFTVFVENHHDLLTPSYPESGYEGNAPLMIRVIDNLNKFVLHFFARGVNSCSVSGFQDYRV